MKITLRDLRSIISEVVNDRSVTSVYNDDYALLKPGDLVDVDMEYHGIYRVRVTELYDDITGLIPNASGPGFSATVEHAEGHDPPMQGEELIFSVDDIIPRSKQKYYFPDLGDEDEYGRPMQNPYRKISDARR